MPTHLRCEVADEWGRTLTVARIFATEPKEDFNPEIDSEGLAILRGGFKPVVLHRLDGTFIHSHRDDAIAAHQVYVAGLAVAADNKPDYNVPRKPGVPSLVRELRVGRVGGNRRPN